MIPIPHYLTVSAILFTTGAIGVLMRRNALIMLICIEVMLNAAGLAFVAAGARWGAVDGQVMFLFILTVAAVGAARQRSDRRGPVGRT